MDQSPTLPPPARRTRAVVLIGLAVLGVAIVGLGPTPTVLRMLSVPLRRPTWFVWFQTINGVALLTVLALPVAVLTAWALARRRTAGGVPSAWRSSVAEVGMVYGTVPWIWLIMVSGGLVKAVNLVPLRDLDTMPPVQIIGNLLPFAALGFFAPLRFAALASVPRILALAAGCSVVVEVAQYVLPMDRVSSVDDVLLNAAGAGLAALASRPWWQQPSSAAVR
jgi:hypothetical protein